MLYSGGKHNDQSNSKSKRFVHTSFICEGNVSVNYVYVLVCYLRARAERCTNEDVFRGRRVLRCLKVNSCICFIT